ncbi:hypothetical protein KAT51_06245 [bacterium]|nr:hypothetical protein [bacterium]
MEKAVVAFVKTCGLLLFIWAIIEEIALYKANKELDKDESERKKFVLGAKTSER